MWLSSGMLVIIASYLMMVDRKPPKQAILSKKHVIMF